MVIQSVMKTLSVWLLALSAVSPSIHAEGKPLSIMNKGLSRCCTVPVQVVPYGIESVNGSDVNMRCTSPLVDRGGVMMSEKMSHLVDGCSPDIDTSTSDWASQLVTVRKSFTDDIRFQHVLLTFGFNTAVSRLTGIELDLFLCPEWKIGAPYITVYADEEFDLVFTNPRHLTFVNHITNQSSCDSLSNISIPFIGSTYHTAHILVTQFGSAIDWVHVGEVRFLGTDLIPMICTTMVSTTTPNTRMMTTLLTKQKLLTHPTVVSTNGPTMVSTTTFNALSENINGNFVY